MGERGREGRAGQLDGISARVERSRPQEGEAQWLVENLGGVLPLKRCVVHLYRGVWTAVRTGNVRELATMLKAVHAQEDAQAPWEMTAQVVEKPRTMKMAWAAHIVAAGVYETLSH